MRDQTYKIPYSKSVLEFTLPASMQVTVPVSQPAEPSMDVSGAIKKALDHPVASPRLRELAKPGDRVCIAFTDITRDTPDNLLVPALFAELEEAGIQDENITLLCGIGMHRPSTQEEKATKLGVDIVRHYRVIDNVSQNPTALVDWGITPGGVPIRGAAWGFEMYKKHDAGILKALIDMSDW